MVPGGGNEIAFTQALNVEFPSPANAPTIVSPTPPDGAVRRGHLARGCGEALVAARQAPFGGVRLPVPVLRPKTASARSLGTSCNEKDVWSAGFAVVAVGPLSLSRANPGPKSTDLHFGTGVAVRLRGKGDSP